MRTFALLVLLLSGCNAADFPAVSATSDKPQATQENKSNDSQQKFRAGVAAGFRNGER